LYWDLKLTKEEEENYIRKTAAMIHRYGMETAAILFLASTKPLAYVGGQLGRFFISPFLPAISENVGLTGEKLFLIFENRENIEKLIVFLEEMAQDQYDWEKHREMVGEPEEEKKEKESSEEKKVDKKGWRRFLPF
jgi:hypothetical protein